MRTVVPVWKPALLKIPAATVEEGKERIVAVARLARSTDPAEAESAIVVRDDHQDRGLGTHLLKLLVEVARATNIERLTAWVMAENPHMLHVIQKLGMNVYGETRHKDLTSGQTRL
jgi:RimJ/RimL family protein N-acetyltransferase